MKRQIKFRAWDSIRMTTSGIMFNCSTGELCTPEGANMKLMQFTGLQDINRKDIYEGDILKIGQSLRGEVIYIDKNCNEYGDETHGAFHVVVFNRNKTIPFDSYLIENGIIIGNIYENPELLKTTENE